jgi:hypothetical protein
MIMHAKRRYLILGVALLIAGGVTLSNWRKAREQEALQICLNNLRAIDGAKEQWGMEWKRSQLDGPTMDELVGTDKYIKVMPVCPAGGVYTVGGWQNISDESQRRCAGGAGWRPIQTVGRHRDGR